MPSMPSSGSLKATITADANLTPGEDRTLRYVVKDADGVNISSFSGWTFGWYLLPKQSTPRTSSDVIITKITGSGITDSVPNVDVALDPADTLTAVKAGTYFYELWRTDADDVVRLAYGPITFID
jgi:hypothetical protein